MTEVFWLLLIASGIIGVTSFGAYSRNQLRNNREVESVGNIHRTVSGMVTLEVFQDVMVVLGEFFSIDPGLIRPSDSLQKIIDCDSWRLDAGVEKLNEWLLANGVDAANFQPKTVLELCVAVERARESSRG